VDLSLVDVPFLALAIFLSKSSCLIDPAGNPHLQFAVLCLSGLDGILKKTEPPAPTELNVYQLTYEERKERGIVSLPESLSEALEERSELARDALGVTLYENYLREKHREWDLYRTQVTSWEVERYIGKLRAFGAY
jgi:glutamine synthetase